MRRQNRLVAASLLVAFAAVTGFTAPANAVVLQTELIDGNDCAGVFGRPFPDCRVAGSPSIIKFDADLGVDEVSINFPSITGDEFTFTVTGVDNSTGFWEYVRGPDDPEVKFWTAVAGSEFLLFYLTDESTGTREDALAVTPDLFPLAEWATPEGRELSHLTFFDSGDFPPVPPGEIPEPLSLLLLGAGLLGLGFARRRVVTS